MRFSGTRKETVTALYGTQRTSLPHPPVTLVHSYNSTISLLYSIYHHSREALANERLSRLPTVLNDSSCAKFGIRNVNGHD